MNRKALFFAAERFSHERVRAELWGTGGGWGTRSG